MAGSEKKLNVTTLLRLEFPFGKFHATPWGRNVNEGLPEWPPAPWRVLRTLYAIWKTRCNHLNAKDVEMLLTQLAGLPTIHVPEARTAHTRHYMPQLNHHSFRKKLINTTLTFDSFMVMNPHEPVLFEWDVELTIDLRETLQKLVAELSYLGRAESICDASVIPEKESVTFESWRPVYGSETVDTEVLCANLPFEFNDLVQSPDNVRRNGRLYPNGSRIVPYRRNRKKQIDTIVARHIPQLATVQAVRFTVQPRPRPTIANAVAVGDLLRRAAIQKHRDPSEVLSGKTEDGKLIRDRHQHAHYLALAKDDRSDPSAPIDSLVVWAPRELSITEFVALARIKWLKAVQVSRNLPTIAVAVSGFGEIEKVAPEIVGPSRIWRSLTPFAPSRRGYSSSWAEHVCAEIERESVLYRGLPAPVSVSVLNDDVRSYRCYRLPPKENLGSRRRAVMVRIEFEEPVKGPLALGALSHFGLGFFLPIK